MVVRTDGFIAGNLMKTDKILSKQTASGEKRDFIQRIVLT